jgi:glycosyltransferase involved in cell wall biosynthesis
MNQGHGRGSPTLSIGIPVRNVEGSISRTLDSALAQEGVDLEVVISDNASDDATEEICRSYAAKDPRVRYERRSHNAGQIANFNRVFTLSTGRYFRWMGAGDTIAPGYASACVATLDAEPGTVVVTTRFTYVCADGSTLDAGGHAGPSDPDRVGRLREILRLLNGGYLAIDPVYGMLRRSALEGTALLRPQVFTDQLLTVELALAGTFGIIPQVLATREHPRFLRPAEAARTYGVPHWRARFASIALCRSIAELIHDAPDLTPAQRHAALRVLADFYAQRHAGNTRRRARKVVDLLTGSRPPHLLRPLRH